MNAPKTTSQQGLRRTMTVSPDVRWSRTDDGGLLLDIKTSKYYSLNSVGATIWEGLATGATVDEVACKVREQFGASGDQVQSDLISFVQALEQKGVITYASPAGD